MAKRIAPRCYKIRVVSKRFIIQQVDVDPSGVTLLMKRRRVEDKWRETCRRQGLECDVEVKSVPCSKKGSGKGKIREFIKFRKTK